MIARNQWRLFIHKDFSPAKNMAVDEALLESVRSNNSLPVLRFYSWKPPAVSVGYFQKIEEIDLEKCRSYGIGYIRRLTGGQAVLHDDELTYSVVVRISHADKVTEIFKKINSSILRGLINLGIKAELFHGKINVSEKKSICFAAPASYEVKVDGKKILGSAQVKRGKVVLQHGSLPISMDCGKLYDLFKFKGFTERKRAIRYSKWLMTSLADELKSRIEFDFLCKVIIEGFSKEWGIDFKPDSLNKFENNLAERLEEERYSTESWNHMR